MEKSYFFKSINGDRRYSADDFASLFALFIKTGVYVQPVTNLKVIAKSNMTITVKGGNAWIQGFGYENTADLDFTLDVADGALRRLDRVVLRLDKINREIILAIKKGIPSSVPNVPSLQRDGDIYELVLADITVNAGTIRILDSNITDRRYDATVCGVVSGVIDQIDTTNLFAQFATEFNEFMTGTREALSEDVAGNLLLLIQANASALNDKAPKTTATLLMDGLMSGLDKEKLDHIDQFATKNEVLYFDLTIPTAGWVNDVLTITVTGINASDRPKVGLVANANKSTAKQQEIAWSRIYKISTEANAIKVYRHSAIDVPIPIQMEVVR